MRPEIRFILACGGMSAVITYVFWMRYRVWSFRRDLFSIRDRLWSTMLERGELDDPSHRAFRLGVNALIGIAPMLTPFTLLRLLFDSGRTEALLDLPISSEGVFAARNEVFLRVSRYIINETLTGLAFLTIMRAFRMAQSFRAASKDAIQKLFDTHVFEHLAEAIPSNTSEMARAV